MLGALLAGLLASGAAAGEALSGSGRSILRHTARAGGEAASAAGVVLHNSVGEIGGALSGAGRALSAGYQPLAAWPGSVTSLVALSKTSGTLELAWTAPGRDGFAGAVAAGSYRVDWSSDPAHPFAPASYRLELATSVVPGAAQALTLTGLEPNTTYYARVWLGDERKAFAEDSRRAEESTLAGVVDPVLASVSESEAVITWALPAGGAASFSAAASTGAGMSAPLVNAATGPLSVSLTIAGLAPDTTYFFQVASLNWQGEPAYTVILATRTRASAVPQAPVLVSLAPDAPGRKVTLTWAVPSILDPRGVLVLVSTSPAAAVADGTDPAVGQTFPDGGVVRSTAVATTLTDTGLALNATYFYHLFQYNQALAYSVRVTTAVFLDLPPLGAGGLRTALSPAATAFTVAWSGVASNDDGTLFTSTGAPPGWELSRYEILRATSIVKAGWVAVATVSAGAAGFTDELPVPGAVFYYRVDSIDSFGNRGRAMAVDTQGNFYALSDDGVTRLRVPAALAGELRGSSNRWGADLTVRVVEEPADGSQRVLRSARFEARRLPGLEPVADFSLSSPAEVALSYGEGSGLGPASAADGNVGLYWNNGAKYVKLFGQVDAQAKTVTAQTPVTGSFQVRDLLRTGGFTFDVSQRTNKAITPNGDGLNDAAVFVFDNPKDSAYSGRVYDLRGGFVAEMSQGPAQYSLQWDGKAGGRPVDGGVYVYQIRAEDKVFNGTLVVIR